MNILMPTTITSAMFVSSTVAEPHASETTWVSLATYVEGDKRIRTGTHREYKCILAHTGRSALPEDDTVYWEDYGPTVKWAPFDVYVSTPATGSSPLTHVVSPGFADSVSLYGLVGSTATLTVKDGPGGATLDTRTTSLYAESYGLYEYLFGPKFQKTKVIFSDLVIHPTAEFTLSITGSGTMELGMFNVGAYASLLGDWGGTVYGASVEPVTYSRIRTDPDTGRVSIRRGNAATGMRASVVVPTEDANNALAIMQRVLDVPVSYVATDAVNYEGLNVFGLGSASLAYEAPGMTRMSITVKGMI